MSTADEHRVADRAGHLLPEEVAAGSANPEAQAEAILAESDERTAAPERTQQESPQSPDTAHFPKQP
jgi:hypothetical protein